MGKKIEGNFKERMNSKRNSSTSNVTFLPLKKAKNKSSLHFMPFSTSFNGAKSEVEEYFETQIIDKEGHKEGCFHGYGLKGRAYDVDEEGYDLSGKFYVLERVQKGNGKVVYKGNKKIKQTM